MYPRNNASPERIAVGPVVQISDGAVQTSGVSIKVKPQGASASAGGGTTTYEEGIVGYVPTQAETDYTSFQVIAYKTGCIPASVTVVTTASATPGYAGLDWGKVTNPTTTVGLSGTTVKTVTDRVTANTDQIEGVDATDQLSTALAAYLGALSASASSGDPGTTTTLVQYLKQIVNTLEGTAGIPTYPSAAAPGNAVSLAEAIRSIYTQLGVAGAGLTAIGDTRLDALLMTGTGSTILNLLRLMIRSDAGAETDLAAIKTLINTNLGSGAGSYDPSDFSLMRIGVNAETAQINTGDISTQIGAAGAGLTNLGGMSTTMKGQVQTEVEEGAAVALNTAVPGSPTAGSINERLKTMDDADMPGSLTTLLGRVTSTLFSGITSLGDWLRRLARKDSGSAGMIVAESEIDTGGTSTFTGTTDNLEAIKDAGGGGGGGGGETTSFSAAALAQLAGLQVNISPTFSSLRNLQIVAGDDYEDDVDNALTMTLSGITQDMAGATAALHWERGDEQYTWSSLSVTASGDDYIFKFERTAAQTAVMTVANDWNVALVVTLASSKRVTLARTRSAQVLDAFDD